MDLSVTFLGTAASVPSAARGTSSIMIARGGERILVDCGEGTQRQLLRSGLGLGDVDLVLVSHLHGDHWLGLPGLLKTYALRGRAKPLRLVGPRGLYALLEVVRRAFFGRVGFPFEVEEARFGVVWQTDGAFIECFPTDHRIESLGYALVEDERPGAFDLVAARARGVPAGPLFGVLQRGGEVTLDDGRTVLPDQVMGQARPGRRIVVSGDTRPCEAVVEHARGARLLIHEATFLDEDHERAVETRHSTVREAAIVARRADVGLLAMTHLSSRFGPREARREAAREFPRAVVARDFDQIEIPFPERGEPRLRSLRDSSRRRPEPVEEAAIDGAASERPASLPAVDL